MQCNTALIQASKCLPDFSHTRTVPSLVLYRFSMKVALQLRRLNESTFDFPGPWQVFGFARAHRSRRVGCQPSGQELQGDCTVTMCIDDVSGTMAKNHFMSLHVALQCFTCPVVSTGVPVSAVFCGHQGDWTAFGQTGSLDHCIHCNKEVT